MINNMSKVLKKIIVGEECIWGKKMKMVVVSLSGIYAIIVGVLW